MVEDHTTHPLEDLACLQRPEVNIPSFLDHSISDGVLAWPRQFVPGPDCQLRKRDLVSLYSNDAKEA